MLLNFPFFFPFAPVAHFYYREGDFWFFFLISLECCELAKTNTLAMAFRSSTY